MIPTRSRVSVLFNESKLLKSVALALEACSYIGFSTLQRVEIAEIINSVTTTKSVRKVSVLFNESKLLKYRPPLPSAPLFQIPITTLRCS